MPKQNLAEWNKTKADENRTAVFNCFMQNPGIHITEIADILNLNRRTVGKHLRAIRNGWRPVATK